MKGQDMKPGEVATLLGIARSTVTLWTNNDFKQYFTPGAQGGGGNRSFTEQDVRVMNLLKTLKASNTPAEQIHQQLQQLQADDWQGLPDMPQAQSVAHVPVMPTAAADAAMSMQQRGYLREIQILNEQLDHFRVPFPRGSPEWNPIVRVSFSVLRKQHCYEVRMNV